MAKEELFDFFASIMLAGLHRQADIFFTSVNRDRFLTCENISWQRELNVFYVMYQLRRCSISEKSSLPYFL